MVEGSMAFPSGGCRESRRPEKVRKSANQEPGTRLSRRFATDSGGSFAVS